MVTNGATVQKTSESMIRILVVDDEERRRRELVKAASGEGREVVWANGLEQALVLIEANDFDLIITDVRLDAKDIRNVDGLTILEASRGKDPTTQVIVVTGFMPIIEGTAMKMGAYDFITRTIDYEPKLIRSISGALKLRNESKGRDD